MLKPGGYLQWDEFDYPDAHVENSDSSIPTPALHELRKKVFSRGENDWTVRLSGLFAEQGLLDTMTYLFEDSPEFTRANSELRLSTMDIWASNHAKAGRTVEATTLSNLVQNASHEIADGAALSVPKVVCVGRKGTQEVKAGVVLFPSSMTRRRARLCQQFDVTVIGYQPP